MKKILFSVAALWAIAALLIVSASAQVSPTSQTQQAVEGLVQSLQAQFVNSNAAALSQFNLACQNWTATNQHNKDLGLPIQPKPAAPLVQHLNVTLAANLLSFSVAPVAGPDTVAPPCPDLPSGKLPANTVQIGQSLGGNWYAVGPQDTMALSSTVTCSTASSCLVANGQTQAAIAGHSFVKVGSAINGTNSDGFVPGWYLEIN